LQKAIPLKKVKTDGQHKTIFSNEPHHTFIRIEERQTHYISQTLATLVFME